MSIFIDCILPEAIETFYPHQDWKRVLQLLLARADCHRLSDYQENAQWLQWFGAPYNHENSPIAPFTALADGLNAYHDYWLRVDPYQLQVNWSGISGYIADPSCIDLFKLKPTIEKLKGLFSDYDISLYAPCAERWYLHMNFIPQITTHPPEITLQSDVKQQWLQEHTPKRGSNYVPWNQLLTEVQMILYENKAPFNALWCWGGGQLYQERDESQIAKSWTHVWANLPLLKGLAIWSGYAVSSPYDYNLLAAPNEKGEAYHFLELRSLMPDKILEIFKQLVKGLQNGKIKELRLYDKRGYIYSLNPYTICRFWRYKLPSL